MSFGKLLAAGKSFVGGKDMGRYRVNSRACLPKFISPKNPFVQSSKETPAQSVHSETPAGTLPNQAADTDARAASADQFSSRAAHASVWSKVWKGSVACARTLNPLRLFRRRAPGPKTALPCFNEKPVQAELSLERVRVMRNDLSEADLEVEVVTPGVARPKYKSPSDESAWGRLAARVFGTETT